MRGKVSGGLCDFRGCYRLLRLHPIRCRLCFARGGNERALVGFQNLQPAREISGMIGPQLMRDAEIGEHKGSGKFCDQLFPRVSFSAKAAGEIAIKPVLCA